MRALIIPLALALALTASASEPRPPALVAVTGTERLDGFAGVFLRNARVIAWDSNHDQENVRINLLRKTADSPITYEYIKTVAATTANDGQETWKPGFFERTRGLYVEVTCTTDDIKPHGCQVVGAPVEIQ